jgi:hypothetical protein
MIRSPFESSSGAIQHPHALANRGGAAARAARSPYSQVILPNVSELGVHAQWAEAISAEARSRVGAVLDDNASAWAGSPIVSATVHGIGDDKCALIGLAHTSEQHADPSASSSFVRHPVLLMR